MATIPIAAIKKLARELADKMPMTPKTSEDMAEKILRGESLPPGSVEERLALKAGKEQARLPGKESLKGLPAGLSGKPAPYVFGEPRVMGGNTPQKPLVFDKMTLADDASFNKPASSMDDPIKESLLKLPGGIGGGDPTNKGGIGKKVAAAAIGVGILGSLASEDEKESLSTKLAAAEKKSAVEVADKKKPLGKSVAGLFKSSSNVIDSKYPMPKAPKKFESQRQDFSQDLQNSLTDIGNKYEADLSKLESKEDAEKSRAAMKNIMKGLIDAASILYLAKHAPSAQYAGLTDPAEYERELDRLRDNMAVHRGLMADKFGELRDRTREFYKGKDTAEGREEDVSRANFAADQRFEDQTYGAEIGKYQDTYKRSQDAESNRLKRAQIAATRAKSAGKPSQNDAKAKAARGKLVLQTANSLSDDIRNVLDKSTNEDEFRAGMTAIGVSKTEIDSYIPDGMFDDIEGAVKNVPSSMAIDIARSRVAQAYGEAEEVSTASGLSLSPEDEEAVTWARDNQSDPRAAGIIQKVKTRYGLK